MKLVPVACAVAGFAFAGILAVAQTQQTQPDPSDEGTTVLTEPLGEEGEDQETRPTTPDPSYNKRDRATLRALDKITGRSTDFEIRVGEPVVYGSLKMDLEVCYQTPPEEPPESAAFLQIETTDAIRMQSMTVPRLAKDVEGVGGEGIDAEAIAAQQQDGNAPAGEEGQQLLFSGWMFASSPGLSALEHPVYDVWVIRCTQRSPDSSSGPAEPAQ